MAYGMTAQEKFAFLGELSKYIIETIVIFKPRK